MGRETAVKEGITSCSLQRDPERMKTLRCGVAKLLCSSWMLWYCIFEKRGGFKGYKETCRKLLIAEQTQLQLLLYSKSSSWCPTHTPMQAFLLVTATIINNSKNDISAALFGGRQAIDLTFYRNEKEEQQLEKRNSSSKMLRRAGGGMRSEKEPSVSVILPCWSFFPPSCGFYFLVLIRASPPNIFSCACQFEVNEY